ncbi:hypothetical protein ACIQC7_27740 [Kitasatospora sp. NPDC088556]|uniref:hypothetical protein n=1 Tax=Kitasatospora sp. NPDC088556 TaxID=3364076 RepID=UPI0038066C10
MNPIDIRDLALNLNDLIAGLDSHRTRGPLLVTRNGEPEAVIIRHKAYAPRLHHFTQTTGGDLVCRLCSPAKVIVSCAADLGAAVEAANTHWRETHR